MVGAFSYTMYQLFWPEHQREQLLRRGVRATAVILAADPTGNVYNSQPEVRLRLRVTPTSGVAYEAETVMVINPIYVPEFQPGMSVKVRIDPQQPSRVAIEETQNGRR